MKMVRGHIQDRLNSEPFGRLITIKPVDEFAGVGQRVDVGDVHFIELGEMPQDCSELRLKSSSLVIRKSKMGQLLDPANGFGAEIGHRTQPTTGVGRALPNLRRPTARLRKKMSCGAQIRRVS